MIQYYSESKLITFEMQSTVIRCKKMLSDLISASFAVIEYDTLQYAVIMMPLARFEFLKNLQKTSNHFKCWQMLSIAFRCSLLKPSEIF